MIFRYLRPTKRMQRNHRAFSACIRFLLPDPCLRSRIGTWLRRKSPWLNEVCYRWFGWVMVCRILIPRYSKDEIELRSCHADIRQILCDNAILDMQLEHQVERRAT